MGLCASNHAPADTTEQNSPQKDLPVTLPPKLPPNDSMPTKESDDDPSDPINVEPKPIPESSSIIPPRETFLPTDCSDAQTADSQISINETVNGATELPKRPFKQLAFSNTRALKRIRVEGVSVASHTTYNADLLDETNDSSSDESDEDWGAAQTFDEKELDVSFTKTEDSSFAPLETAQVINLRCSQVLSSLSLGYGFAITRGDRPHQEDTYVFKYFEDDPITAHAMAGVFDGHKGNRASQLAQSLLPKYLFSLSNKQIASDPPACLVTAFKRAAEQVATTLQKEENDSGTTALCVLATPGRLAIANAGDCRAVLSRGGTAEDLSRDHTLDLPSERARIEKENPDAIYSNGRLFGVLAVTRSLGDLSFPGLVIAEPEIKVVDLTPQDEFVIVATDGVWGAMTSQQAVNYVRRCAVEDNSFDSKYLADKLMRKAVSLKAGDADNVTVCILSFRQSAK